MLLQPSCAFQSFLTVKFLLKEPSPEAGELFRVELLPVSRTCGAPHREPGPGAGLAAQGLSRGCEQDLVAGVWWGEETGTQVVVIRAEQPSQSE